MSINQTNFLTFMRHVLIDATTAKQLLTVSVACCASRERGLDDVCQQLCVCNAVRDALQGEGLSVRFHQLLLKPSKRLVDFILEVRAASPMALRFKEALCSSSR
jgi:hypothetical protein